jgi:small-conductance mechanosensitive channel
MVTLAFGFGFEDLAVFRPAAAFLLAFLVVYAVGLGIVVPGLVRVVRARNPRNPTLHQAVAQYAWVGTVAAGLVAGTTVAGYGYVLSDSALVVAAVTLALGVAGQEVIGNVVSGVFLVGDSDFNVGDWIEWEGNAGVVEGIGFRVTRVRTAGNEVVTVPNTALTTHPVTNPYSRDRYRASETVEVAYGSDLERAREVLAAAATEVPGVLEDPEPVAHVATLGPGSVTLQFQYWIPNPDPAEVRGVRTTVAERAVERLEKAGVAVAPPAEHELSGRLGVDAEMEREGGR